MKQFIIDLLEAQIIKDGNEKDTTVLYELLNNIDKEVLFNSLSDENRKEVIEKESVFLETKIKNYWEEWAKENSIDKMNRADQYLIKTECTKFALDFLINKT